MGRRRKKKEQEKFKKSRFGTLIFVCMETNVYGLLVWKYLSKLG